MQPDPRRGHTLIVTDDPEAAERLSRWVTATGARPVTLPAGESFLFREGDDEKIDLVITDVDSDAPAARRLIERLLGGELFAGIPHLHLLRDPTMRRRLAEIDPRAASVSMVSPPEAGEFQARVRLAAEVGHLRRELRRSSVRDELTGLYTASFLTQRLEEEIARASRNQTALSVVLFGIERPESSGARPGDADPTPRLAALLRSRARRDDSLGSSIDGSRFAAVLPGTAARGAAVFANKVRGEAEQLEPSSAGGSGVKLSAGVASLLHRRQPRDGPASMLEAASLALEEALRRGGNRVFIDEAALRYERPLVLIADRDPRLLELAEDLLSLDDYRVVCVDSVSTLRETLPYRRPDLLILDLGIDDGDGLALVGEIQGLFNQARLRIIGLCSPGEADPEAVGRLDVEGFLSRPFSVSVLRSLARDLLRRGPSQS